MESILLPLSFLLLILIFNPYIYPGASRLNDQSTLLPRPFFTASFLIFSIFVIFVDKKRNFRKKSSRCVTGFDKAIWYVKGEEALSSLDLPPNEVLPRADLA